jgi:surface antigen
MTRAFEFPIGWAQVAIIAVAIATIAPSARGQHFPTDYALDAEDWGLIHKSEAALFSTNAVGRSQAWANPQNGKKGSIELMRVYQLKGMPCRRMEYVTFVPGHSEPARAVVDWCQIATGEWKLVDPSELEGR